MSLVTLSYNCFFVFVHDALILSLSGYRLFHIHDDLCLVYPLFMLVGGGIFKLLWSPEIDSKESIPSAYVAWRAGTKTLFLLGSWPPQIVQKFQHGKKMRGIT